MAGNTTLGKAKAARNDEFYTQYADIQKEVNAYLEFDPDTFRGKSVNAASPETLRDFPIFEHDPDEMFSAAITTNMQNRILAKGIPALSIPVGISLEAWDEEIEDKVFDMESLGNAPTRTGNAINNRWLHSEHQVDICLVPAKK